MPFVKKNSKYRRTKRDEKFYQQRKKAQRRQSRVQLPTLPNARVNILQKYNAASDEEENDFDALLSQFRSQGQLTKDVENSDAESDESEESLKGNSNDDGEDESCSADTDDEVVDECVEQNNVESLEEPLLIDCGLEIEDESALSTFFRYDLAAEHVNNLTSSPMKMKCSVLKWPVLGRLEVEIPESSAGAQEDDENICKVPPLPLDERIIYAPEGCEPTRDIHDLAAAGVSPKLIENIAEGNKCEGRQPETNLTAFQMELFNIAHNYQDLFYSQENFENMAEIRFVYCLHVVNHVLLSWADIYGNNRKIATAGATVNDDVDLYRDQGLVRPRVLILLPFRSSALKIVDILIDVLYGKQAEAFKQSGIVINYRRFLDDYTGNNIKFPILNPKPEDYEQTFTGDTNDNFKIGISLKRKHLKLYADFYSSDIIVASPLALRTVIGAAGDAERDFDFLNSIEVLIMDQADVFLAQNWNHILHIFDHMHLKLQTLRDTNLLRVRNWNLSGLSHFYRQTMLFASHGLQELCSLFRNRCVNYRGKVKISNILTVGSAQNILIKIPQIWYKVDVDSFQRSFDERFAYFTQEILPKVRGSLGHCMIYVPSYFDFVRIRNYFKAEAISCVQICEYTEQRKIARARDKFYHSESPILLYSERSHFFRRTRIKGIRHLVMYQPPTWPHFYAEIVNLMQDSNQNARDGLENFMSITILYTKYDVYQIRGILGDDHAAKLINSRNLTHVLSAK